MAPWRLPYSPTALVAKRARSRDAPLQPLAPTPLPWSTRGPGTCSAARAAIGQGAPQPRLPRVAGEREQAWASTAGGVAPRWGRLHAAHRQAQAPRTVAHQLRTPSHQAGHAFKQRCGTALAREAEAPQALATVAQGVQATCLATRRVGPPARDGHRGRPRPGRQPAAVGSPLNGAFTARLARRHARVAPPRGGLLATHELAATWRPPPARWPGDPGQRQAARGCRVLTAPPCFASARSRKQPERSMALLMGLPGCVLVDAALAYRLRHALQDHAATFPAPTGQPTQHPTARWVCHACVGMPVGRIPQPWPLVINRAEAHRHRRQLLGTR
jgi:hypothetical protein